MKGPLMLKNKQKITTMNENLILFIFYAYLFDMQFLVNSEVLDLQKRGNHS